MNSAELAISAAKWRRREVTDPATRSASASTPQGQASEAARQEEPYRFPLSPFLADCVISRAAEAAGYTITRRAAITIDAAALPPEYLRKCPDYGKIRKHLEDGVQVPGAELTREVQYVLVRGERCAKAGGE